MFTQRQEAADDFEVISSKNKPKMIKEWKKHAERKRTKLKISDNFSPYSTGTMSSRLSRRMLRCDRTRQTNDLAWVSLHRRAAARKKKNSDNGPKRREAILKPEANGRYAWVDLSQSISRSPWMLGAAPCLTTSSSLFSFEAQLVLRGAAALQLMGWPEAYRRSGSAAVSSNSLRDLAGEGTHLPCLAAVIWAYFVNPRGAWWTEEQGPEAI